MVFFYFKKRIEEISKNDKRQYWKLIPENDTER